MTAATTPPVTTRDELANPATVAAQSDLNCP